MRPYLSWVIPTAAYGVAFGVFYCLGFDAYQIDWQLWQLLDQRALAGAPLQSLYLLHAQPPLLNTLLAVVLQLSAVSGVAPEIWAWAVFALLGLLSTVLLFRILVDVTGSLGLAFAGLVVALSNPAYHLFQSLFFYPFLLYAFLVGLLFCSVRMLKAGHAWLLAVNAVLLGFVANTWSLFHPVWAILAYVLMVVLFYLTDRVKRRLRWTHVALSAATLGILLVAWPLKNYLVFGQFTFSTWEGYNLARGTDVESQALNDYIYTGAVPESTKAAMAEFQRAHGLAQIDVLSQELTSAGGRNWNHYLLLEVNKPLQQAAIRYRLDHPSEWLKQIRKNYAAWMRGSYIDPYLGTFLGPDNQAYLRYTSLYDGLNFYDVRPYLEPHFPDFFRALRLKRRPLPLTVFGLVTFPLLMVVSLSLAVRRLWKKQFCRAGVILIPWFTLFWLFLIPCLTDGSEGNRMRFAGTGYLVVLAAIVVKAVAGSVMQHIRHRRGKHPAPDTQAPN